MTTVTIAHAAVNAKLIDAPREVKLEVQQILSYKILGAEQTTRFKSSGWDGRSSFLDFRQGTFPAGFVHLVSAHLKRRGYDVKIVKRPLPEPLGPENPIVDGFPDTTDYEYQNETVSKLLRHGKIIAQIATGGGKSRVAKKVFGRINRPTLFLTTRSLLMYQMKDSFETDMGVKVSVLGDGHWGTKETQPDGTVKTSLNRMTVGMVQTLNARLEVLTLQGEFEKVYDSLMTKEKADFAKKKTELKLRKVDSVESARVLREFAIAQESVRPSAEAIKTEAAARVARQDAIRANAIAVLAMFEVVILEEAHEASGAGFYGIMSHCVNAHYRLALTATPFMKDDEEANMKLMAVAGPVGIKVTEKMLIDRGILAKPFFKYCELSMAAAKLYRSTSWAPAYRLGIVDYEFRNQLIVQECSRAKQYGITAMVLVQHKAHGETLLRKMDAAGLRAEFIFGESDHGTRKIQLRKLAEGAIDVLIGSTILDVGVDCPAVGMIILAGGGKAEVALRQRIGRGLRRKKSGPNISFVIDFCDNQNEHLRAHYLQRRAIVEHTEGFGENIIAANSDFNYEALGFKKVS